MNAPAHIPLKERLEHGYAPRLAPIYDDVRDEVLAYAAERAEPLPARRHAELLVHFCERQRDAIAAHSKAEATFQTRFASAADEAEQRAAVLDFARQLGADGRQLRRDSDAFEQYFDADAVFERYTKRVGERERALAYGLDRLGIAMAQALVESPAFSASNFFEESYLAVLAEMRCWAGDPRVRHAAHSSVRQMAQALPEQPEEAWFDILLSATRRASLDESEDVWAQCEAADALLALSPDSIPAVIERRLSVDLSRKPALVQDRALFLHRHYVRLIFHNFDASPRFAKFVPIFANNQEGAVRQACAECVTALPIDRAKGLLTRLRVDRDPQVRAAIFANPDEMVAHVGGSIFAQHICRIFTHDRDEFVLRIALDAAGQTCRYLRTHDSNELPGVVEQLRDGLDTLQTRTDSGKVLRWLDEARERIWFYATPEALEIAKIIVAITDGQREGSVRRARALRPYLEEGTETVGRVMAVLAQRDFGLSLNTGFLTGLQRGEFFRRRLWRILFEGRNSATDKRQAFQHAIGRHYYGSIWAPSARMAELAPTKVPGEPLFESSEGGWRNYLPLLDQALSALDRGGTVEIFTSAGITSLTAPAGVWQRMRAFWRISRDFPRMAALRNREPDAYLKGLRELGLEIGFRAYSEGVTQANPKVTKLYSFGGAVALVPVLWDRALAYFSTVFENNLVELAIFVALASLWFFGRHAVLGWRARRLRDGLSLVLGGWGTRGKSGTERLKAGLINALGPSIVSKTTGCEAMFLLGNSYGELTEMFLFRPYDKATIWEQYNLLKTADGLDTRVFLWECMGLNPAYVRVLQQDWMRDDIGTITNTYPDHEDVQGPAGRNIPEVMCEFIPHDSLLLTTEEEMLPILAEGSDKARTEMRAVTWKEAGLIHQSLLNRFPYEEHPYNIALVTEMGAELGLEADYCIKEMSDRVVADLGVLKTYPRSLINGRTLEFVMGMSANERFGAMGNWTRMGFVDHSLTRDPDIFVSTVVNNRADRVPRSRVFARMLVHDVSADRHFLIGSNIEGLLGFIDEEWDAYAAGLTLVEEGASPADRLETLARHQRIPVSTEELEGRLAAMVAGLGQDGDAAIDAHRKGALETYLLQVCPDHAEAILAHHTAMASFHADYLALADKVKAGGDHNPAIRDLLGRAFKAKLAPVFDYYIKGEMIVRLVAEQTPPGLVNRIMGMQNIKGTGLDWVYRWQAWEAVAKAVEQLGDEDPGLVERGYRTLATFQEFGVLSEHAVLQAVEGLRTRLDAVPAISNAQLDALAARVRDQLRQFDNSAVETGDTDRGNGWLSKVGGELLAFTEAFIDAGDAVRRRKKSDAIYKALIAEQISSQRAASELKKLTSRQKGGWLPQDLKEWSEALVSLLRRS